MSQKMRLQEIQERLLKLFQQKVEDRIASMTLEVSVHKLPLVTITQYVLDEDGKKQVVNGEPLMKKRYFVVTGYMRKQFTVIELLEAQLAFYLETKR